MIINKHNISSINLSKQELLEKGCTFIINKELTWTSNDVVSKLRSFFKTKRVGHAGSLDPFATGLLIISIGKNTKKLNEYTDYQKKYIATVKFGAETVSFDAEHPEINVKHLKEIDLTIIENSLRKFKGKFQQTAPVYSAKKVNGKRHYELSRKNIIVEPKVKEVEIFDLTPFEIYLPFFEFEVTCSKGTYIRSLANDIGKETGYKGYLFKLIRTRIGDFHLDDALKIGEIINLLK